jgi:hypothetical protein
MLRTKLNKNKQNKLKCKIKNNMQNKQKVILRKNKVMINRNLQVTHKLKKKLRIKNNKTFKTKQKRRNKIFSKM